jgi:hypothetical protein
MERFVAMLNIERFRRRLAEARDPREHAHFERLLAEEQERLREAEALDREEEPRRASISELVEQYRHEASPIRRDMLKRRLIEEEDRFGSLWHQIDLIDDLIKRGVHTVELLEALSAARSENARSFDVDLGVLKNSREILGTLKAHRAALAERARTIN